MTRLLLPLLLLFHHATADQQATYNVINSLDSISSAILVNTVSNLNNKYPPTITSTSLVTVVAETCVAGGYSLIDSQVCTLCLPGKYSASITAVSVDTCLSCGSGMYSTAAGAVSGGTCSQCPINTYFTGTVGTSLAACLPCPVSSGSYAGSQLLQSCVCLPGYSGANGEKTRFQGIVGARE